MKAHKLFNKAVAGVLSLALALGIAPVAIGGGAEAYAASATPSVGAYADKTALTDGTFKPNDDGTATNIGKISLGGKAWYLLGGEGTNVDVFAAEDITSKIFRTDISTARSYDSSYGTYASAPTQVYPNHYGASDIRAALQDMAKVGGTDTTFNSVEKAMMNDTTVETTDTQGTSDTSDDLTYTTTDKLYLAKEGSNFLGNYATELIVNGKKLSKSTYWSDASSRTMFWLRSPASYDKSNALLAADGYYVTNQYTSYNSGVRPAVNLDFSSVLFASAAPVVTSNTDKTNIDSDIMNLRLEATESTTVTKAHLGEVSVNATDGTITATKGSDSATLVVQGNDGTSDWYYTKALSAATTTIRASDIADDVDLANCKVWLEGVGSDGMTYAVNATAPAKYEITTSVINGRITSASDVEEGEDKTIEYQANEGYTLKSITVDGTSMSIADYPDSYTFTNVQEAHSIRVVFEPAVYSITYKGLEDATVSGNPQSYTIESDTITLNSPTKTGYAFEGWTTDEVTTPTKDLTIESGSTGNKTFTANWVIYTYIVTFDAGDQINEVMVDYDHKITKPDDPTKDGYKFGGWYTDQACTTAWDFDEDTVTKDLTLYAKWTKVDGNGGSGSDNNGSGSSNTDSSSKTGDDTNVLGLLAILTLAGAGAGTVFIRRRHS